MGCLGCFGVGAVIGLGVVLSVGTWFSIVCQSRGPCLVSGLHCLPSCKLAGLEGLWLTIALIVIWLGVAAILVLWGGRDTTTTAQKERHTVRPYKRGVAAPISVGKGDCLECGAIYTVGDRGCSWCGYVVADEHENGGSNDVQSER